MNLNLQLEQDATENLRDRILGALRNQPPGHWREVVAGAARELGMKTISLALVLRGGVHFGPAKGQQRNQGK